MRLPTVTPQRFTQIAYVALAFLTLIVLTGAAVRVTGSGLGCPTWPKCTETQLTAPLTTHGIIEFGNRLLTFAVGFAALAPFVAAFRRRPYRRDLMLVAAALPLGVAGQAVLGGMTVLYGLEPSWVMAHFLLSMVILVAAVTLVWRARREPGEERPRPADRRGVLATRALLPVGALTLFAGTAATAAGPHAGGSGTGDIVPRLDFKGAETLDWLIHQHGRIATVLGLMALGLWLHLRRRGDDVDPTQRRSVTALVALLGAQGAVGFAQYRLELPAELVWLHVSLAAFTWVAILFAVAAAGSPAPRREPTPEASDAPPARVPTAA